MSKIKTIRVLNIKAVSEQSADFNGCTAIITGGNNKGKTTFLRALPDRLRQTKPEIILKEGEHDGFYEMVLTDGNTFRWEVTDKTKAGEKLMFITKENIKTAVTRAIADKYFPPTFDVDKFLQDQPMKQRKTLQELVGLDFTDIDNRYDLAYKDREGKNRTANEEKIKFEGTDIPGKREAVKMETLTSKKQTERDAMTVIYRANQEKNTATRVAYGAAVESQRKIATGIQAAESALDILFKCGYEGKEVTAFISEFKKLVKPPIALLDLNTTPDHIPEDGQFILIKELPDDAALKEIDKEIIDAIETNRLAKIYTDWVELKDNKDKAIVAAVEADTLVKTIEKERMDLIKSAKMPEGFGFSDSGITYNNLPFTREQLSSSGIYIAALKLAAMTIGEVRTLHFDASFLDRKSLEDIEQWAITQDLQLLIERPDFEGGEITYQLLQPLAL